MERHCRITMARSSSRKKKKEKTTAGRPVGWHTSICSPREKQRAVAAKKNDDKNKKKQKDPTGCCAVGTVARSGSTETAVR